MLDTNVGIDFALARSERLRDRVERVFDDGLAISAITLAELRVGVNRRMAENDDERRLDLLIQTMSCSTSTPRRLVTMACWWGS